MTINITVQIIDNATPVYHRVVSGLAAPSMFEAVGFAGSQVVQKHLRERDRTHPNSFGGPRSHFYSRAAGSTHYDLDSDGATVTVSWLGIRQRYYGGTIRPRRGRAIAFPVNPRAYGKNARDVDGLVAIITGNASTGTLGLLVKPQEGSDFGEVYYILMKSVTQKGDRTVMPSIEDYRKPIERAVKREIKRLKEAGSP